MQPTYGILLLSNFFNFKVFLVSTYWNRLWPKIVIDEQVIMSLVLLSAGDSLATILDSP